MGNRNSDSLVISFDAKEGLKALENNIMDAMDGISNEMQKKLEDAFSKAGKNPRLKKQLTGVYQGLFDDLTKSAGNLDESNKAVDRFVGKIDYLSQVIIKTKKDGKINQGLLDGLSIKDMDKVLEGYDKVVEAEEKIRKYESADFKENKRSETTVKSLKELEKAYGKTGKAQEEYAEKVNTYLKSAGVETSSISKEIKEYSSLLALFEKINSTKIDKETLKNDPDAAIKKSQALLYIMQQITDLEKGNKLLGKFRIDESEIKNLKSSVAVLSQQVEGSINNFVKGITTGLKNEISNTLINAVKEAEKASQHQFISAQKTQAKIGTGSGSGTGDAKGEINGVSQAAQNAEEDVNNLGNALNNLGGGKGGSGNELDLWEASAKNLGKEFENLNKYTKGVEDTFERLNVLWKSYDKGLSMTEDEITEMWGLMKRFDELELNGLTGGLKLNQNQIDEFKEWENDKTYSKLFGRIETMTEAQLAEIEKLKAAKKEVSDQPVSGAVNKVDGTEEAVEATARLTEAEKEASEQAEKLEKELSDAGGISKEKIEQLTSAINELKEKSQVAIDVVIDNAVANTNTIKDKINELPDKKEIEIRVKDFSDMPYLTDPKTGKPLTLYRGTREAISGTVGADQNGLSYYSTDRRVAESYIAQHGGKLITANGAMKNPLEIDAEGSRWDNLTYIGEGFDEVSKKLWNLKDSISKYREDLGKLKKDSSEYKEVNDKLNNALEEQKKILADTSNPYVMNATTDEFADKVKASGLYDGLILKNIIDGGGITATDVVFFDEQQIRNAQVLNSELDKTVQKKEEIASVDKTQVDSTTTSQIETQQKLQAELEETKQQAKETTTALSDGNQTLSDSNQVVKAQDKIQEELRETREEAEKTNAVLSESNQKDILSGDDTTAIEVQDKLESKVEETTSALEEQEKVVKKILYHWGNFTSGQIGEDFGSMISSYFNGLKNPNAKGGYGAFGSGTYALSHHNDMSSFSWKDGELRQFKVIDASEIKMYETKTEENAMALFQFLTELQRLCINLGSGFDYNGTFDKELVTVENMYRQAQDIFGNMFMTVREFESFVSDMAKLVKDTGLGTSVVKTYKLGKKEDQENISTRFMRNLGYEGIDNTGTSFDNLVHGSVIFPKVPIKTIKSFKEASEVIDYYNKNVQTASTLGNQSGVSLGDSDKKLDTFHDKAQNLVNAIKEIYSQFSGTEKPLNNIFNSMFDGIFDENASAEIIKVSNALDLLYESYTITSRIIHDGTTNLGGIISNPSIIGDTEKGITILGRPIEDLEFIKDLKPRLEAAKREGANVAQILDYIVDDTNKIVYEFQETAQGYGTGFGTQNAYTTFLEATDEQILKLISDIEILQKHGLALDLRGDNILFDKENGFSFIDLATDLGYKSGNQNVFGALTQMTDHAQYTGGVDSSVIEAFEGRVWALLEARKANTNAINAENEAELQLAQTREKVATTQPHQTEVSSGTTTPVVEDLQKVEVESEEARNSIQKLEEELKDLAFTYKISFDKDAKYEYEFDKNLEIAQKLQSILDEIYKVDPSYSIDNLIASTQESFDKATSGANEFNNVLKEIRKGTGKWSYNKLLNDPDAFAKDLNAVADEYYKMVESGDYDEKQLLNIEARFNSMLSAQHKLYTESARLNDNYLRGLADKIQSQLSDSTSELQDRFWEAMANGNNMSSDFDLREIVKERLGYQVDIDDKYSINRLKEVLEFLQDIEIVKRAASKETLISNEEAKITSNLKIVEDLKERYQKTKDQFGYDDDPEWFEKQYEIIAEYANKAEEAKAKLAELKGEVYEMQKITSNDVKTELNQSGVLSGNQTEVLSGTTAPAKLHDVVEELEIIEIKEDEVITKTQTMYRAFNSEHGIKGKGISWFGDDLENVGTYIDNINTKKDSLAELTTDISKFFVVDANGSHWGEIMYDGVSRTADELAEMAKQAGYAGIAIQNVYDSYNGIGSGNLGTTFAIFDENVINNAVNNTEELKSKLNELNEIEKHITNTLSSFNGRNNSIWEQAKESFRSVVLEYKNGSITIGDALTKITKSANSILSSDDKEFDFKNKVNELWTSLKSGSKFSDDIYKGYGSTDWKSIVQDFVNGTKTEEQALQELEAEFRNLLELKEATLKPEVNQTPLSSDDKTGEKAKETAEEVKEANEKIEASNEKRVRSEEKVRKYTAASKEDIPRSAKIASSAIVNSNDEVINSNEDVIRSEEKVRKYRSASNNTAPKLKTTSKTTSTIKDTFDANKEASEMEKVATTAEEAAQSKKDFATANEGVQASVDDSKSKLQLEAELMDSIAKSAREAAEAKKEFAKANELVQQSVNNTQNATKNDKYKDKTKVSNEEYTSKSNQYASIANQKLLSNGYTILGESVNTELVDGLVKVSAKIKTAEGAWKTFSAKIDADGNMFEQRFRTITKNVDKLEQELASFGQTNVSSSSGVDKIIEAYETLAKTELDFQKLKAKSSTKRGLTIDEADKLSKLEQIRAKANQTLKQQTDLTEEQTQASKRYANELERVQSLMSRNVVSKEKQALEKMWTDYNRISTNKKDFSYDANYERELDALKSQLKELDGLAENLQFVDDKDIEKFAELRQSAEQALNAIKEKTGNLKFKTPDVADVRKKMNEIQKIMEQNTRMPKDMKDTFEALKRKYQLLIDTKGSVSQFKSLNGELEELVLKLRESGKTGKSFFSTVGAQLKSMNSRLLAYYFSMYDFIRYARYAINAVVELDNALLDLKKTTTMTDQQLENFYYTSNDIAKKMGVTTAQIVEQASAWSRLGYSSEEAATTMAQLSSQFASISPGMETDQAQEGLVSIMKAWDIDTSEVKSEIMDKINILGNSFAESNSDLVEGMKRSAAALAAVGTEYTDAFALFTGAQEVLQNAEVTGRALRSISMRIRGYSESSEDGFEEVDDELKTITGDLIDLTKTAEHSQGVSIFKEGSTTEFKSLVDYFGEISEIWDEMTQVQQNDFLQMAFGKTQANLCLYVQKCT